jgi:hypothetical protein
VTVITEVACTSYVHEITLVGDASSRATMRAAAWMMPAQDVTYVTHSFAAMR